MNRVFYDLVGRTVKWFKASVWRVDVHAQAAAEPPEASLFHTLLGVVVSVVDASVGMLPAHSPIWLLITQLITTLCGRMLFLFFYHKIISDMKTSFLLWLMILNCKKHLAVFNKTSVTLWKTLSIRAVSLFYKAQSCWQLKTVRLYVASHRGHEGKDRTG